MLVSRTALSAGLGGKRTSRAVLAAGLLIVVVGGALVWTSTVAVGTGAGLFLGGLGTGALWPVGIAVALQRAGRAQLEGSARATLASGVAVLVAPSALGFAADTVGVVTAWTIVLAFAAAALVLLAVTPAPAPASVATPDTALSD